MRLSKLCFCSFPDTLVLFCDVMLCLLFLCGKSYCYILWKPFTQAFAQVAFFILMEVTSIFVVYFITCS